MASADLRQKTELALNKYGMLSGTGAVVAGFSGGADSVTLLFVMAQLCRERSIKLYAVHVNHGIRGDEADRDERFCREFCFERGIEFFCEHTDVPALAKKLGRGLEETARDERYRILEAFAERLGAERIMTAHNADDNLETVIFNLVRGSAARGLCGIPPVRGNIIRPLIFCTKAEITEFCRSNGLPFVTDSTNNDTAYTRNFIRQKICPQIKEINPSAAENVAAMCEKLSADCAYLDGLALGLADKSGVKELAALPFPLLSRVAAIKFGRVSDCSLSGQNISDIISLIEKGAKWSRISLPGNNVAVIDGEDFVIKHASEETPPSRYEIPLVPGRNPLPCGGELLITDGGAEEITEGSARISIDADAVSGELYARPRKDGDRIRSGGMTKRLKVIFNEKHIPPARRGSLPVICDEAGTLWVPFCAKRDGTEAGKESRNKLTLIYISEEK